MCDNNRPNNTVNLVSAITLCVVLITASLISCHDRSADKTSPGTLGAKELYEQNCSGCHGADGAAGVDYAANLQLSGADTISIIHIVNQGRKGMPSFEGVLKESEIHKIAGYVFTLRK